LISDHKSPSLATITDESSFVIPSDYHSSISRFWVSLEKYIGSCDFQPGGKLDYDEFRPDTKKISLSNKVSSVVTMNHEVSGTSLFAFVRSV
jgi:hypothetical protein